MEESIGVDVPVTTTYNQWTQSEEFPKFTEGVEVEMSGGRAKKPSPPPCVCECARRIRVSPTVLAAGPITCGVCGTDFTPDLPDNDETGGDGNGEGEPE